MSICLHETYVIILKYTTSICYSVGVEDFGMDGRVEYLGFTIF